MYVNLFVTAADAEKIFVAHARKPLKSGQSGAMVGSTFKEHFDEYTQTYIPTLGAILERSAPKDWDPNMLRDVYALKFDQYVSHTPRPLLALGVEPVRVEIVRNNNEKTSAKAGYYSCDDGRRAVVENVIPTINLNGTSSTIPVVAQNIRVSAHSLSQAQTFNERLSQGLCDAIRVHTWE